MDYRTTALVTGASSGIGTAFAAALAARGSDLVLVARSGDTLRGIADDLTVRHGVRVDVIAQDLTEPGAAEAVRAGTDRLGRRVGILVNNAGFGSGGRFDRIPAERSHREVALDVSAVVDLTSAYLPAMTAAGAGAVLNVASTAAFQPAPGMAVYAASKSFVLSFSEALWAEQRRHGVRVLAVCAGPVRTGFAEAMGVPPVGAGQYRTPEQVVRSALRALDRGRAAVTPGLANAALYPLTRLVPRRLVLAVADRMVGRAIGAEVSPATSAAAG